jgi:hypothetical protein
VRVLLGLCLSVLIASGCSWSNQDDRAALAQLDPIGYCEATIDSVVALCGGPRRVPLLVHFSLEMCSRVDDPIALAECAAQHFTQPWFCDSVAAEDFQECVSRIPRPDESGTAVPVVPQAPAVEEQEEAEEHEGVDDAEDEDF